MKIKQFFKYGKIEYIRYDNTLWLTDAQIAILFKCNIMQAKKYITNALNKATNPKEYTKEFKIVNSENKRTQALHYNLSVIMSITKDTNLTHADGLIIRCCDKEGMVIKAINEKQSCSPEIQMKPTKKKNILSTNNALALLNLKDIHDSILEVIPHIRNIEIPEYLDCGTIAILQSQFNGSIHTFQITSQIILMLVKHLESFCSKEFEKLDEINEKHDKFGKEMKEKKKIVNASKKTNTRKIKVKKQIQEKQYTIRQLMEACNITQAEVRSHLKALHCVIYNGCICKAHEVGLREGLCVESIKVNKQGKNVKIVLFTEKCKDAIIHRIDNPMPEFCN